MPVLPTLAAGGLLLAAVYAAGTLLLGFWSAADLRQVQELHARLARGRPFFIGRILGWAARRAEAATCACTKRPSATSSTPATRPCVRSEEHTSELQSLM